MSEHVDKTENSQDDDDTAGHGHPGEHPAFPGFRNGDPTAPKSSQDDDDDDTAGHLSGAVRPDPN